MYFIENGSTLKVIFAAIEIIDSSNSLIDWLYYKLHIIKFYLNYKPNNKSHPKKAFVRIVKKVNQTPFQICFTPFDRWTTKKTHHQNIMSSSSLHVYLPRTFGFDITTFN